MAGLRLYFLRHGKALSRAAWEEDDDLRPLTPEGVAEVQRIGAYLAGAGLRPGVIVSSPLVRAWRTAELVAEALGLGERLVADERLGHGFDRSALAGVVAEHGAEDALLLVGHEPSFSAVVGELIGGGRVVCKKGGLARVDVDGPDLAGGRLVWLLSPAHMARG